MASSIPKQEPVRFPWYRVSLIAASVLAVAVRLVALRRDWLWYDEFYSAVFASAADQSKVLASIQQHDFHPPLYYMKLRAWAAISTTEGWMLANSLMWGLVALAGVYVAGSKLAGRWGGLFSLLLLSVLPLAVKEASELRMYAALMGLSSWAVLAIVQQITTVGWRSWAWGAAACALSCALSWSHGAGFLWLPVWAAFALGVALLRADTHEGLRGFLVWFGVATVGSIPCVLEATRRRPGHLMDSESAEWLEILGQLVPGAEDAPGTVSLILLVALGAVSVINPSKTRSIVALAFSLCVAMGALFVVSRQVPAAHVRTVTFLAPVFCIVIGAAAGTALLAPQREIRIIAFLAPLALSTLAFFQGLPLLENPNRSPIHQKLAKNLSQERPIWAPRLGSAYALCWQLSLERRRIDPVGPVVCQTDKGVPIFTGSMHPPGLMTPYTLVLRKGERVPPLRGNERRGASKKLSGHLVKVIE